MKSKTFLVGAIGAVMIAVGGNVSASPADLLGAIVRSANAYTAQAPSDATIDVAFSPEAGAEKLVLRTIDSAQKELRVSAYSFTSAPVTEALIRAHKRGVDVAVVADEKSNVVEDRSGKGRAALSALANAGVRVRTVSAYPIHHDKVIIADGRHVETGSFNFSSAAANRNSENVIVIWNRPDIASRYLAHWKSRFDQGYPFAGR